MSHRMCYSYSKSSHFVTFIRVCVRQHGESCHTIFSLWYGSSSRSLFTLAYRYARSPKPSVRNVSGIVTCSHLFMASSEKDSLPSIFWYCTTFVLKNVWLQLGVIPIRFECRTYGDKRCRQKYQCHDCDYSHYNSLFVWQEGQNLHLFCRLILHVLQNLRSELVPSIIIWAWRNLPKYSYPWQLSQGAWRERYACSYHWPYSPTASRTKWPFQRLSDRQLVQHSPGQ